MGNKQPKEEIRADEVYYFTKSMNKVRTLEKLQNDEWTVERVDSKKKMIVNARALVKEDDLEAHGIFI